MTTTATTNLDHKRMAGRMQILSVLTTEEGKPYGAMATATPDLLHELAFISTYETKDPWSTSPQQHGYQREPMTSRFSGIAAYYARGKNRFLIPPIIASARVDDDDIELFNKLFAAGNIEEIHRRFSKAALSIVDGQHRAGGLYRAWEKDQEFNADVPIMVFYGLDYKDEARLFDDINMNQRKLPKALVEATKQHTEAGDKTHPQIVREIAFAVAQDGDSVWKDLINMTGARDPDRSVTYEGLRRATAQMFPARLINRLSAVNMQPETTAKKYWKLVASACSPAWNDQTRWALDEHENQVEETVHYRIKDLVGVAALAKLGEDMLNTSLDRSRNNQDAFWDALTDMVSKLSVVDWEKRPNNPWMSTAQAGFAGQKELYEILYNLVYLDQQPGVGVHE